MVYPRIKVNQQSLLNLSTYSNVLNQLMVLFYLLSYILFSEFFFKKKYMIAYLTGTVAFRLLHSISTHVFIIIFLPIEK